MYCKKCGKPIDRETMCCSGCGESAAPLSGGVGFWDLAGEKREAPVVRPTPPTDKTLEKKLDRLLHEQKKTRKRLTILLAVTIGLCLCLLIAVILLQLLPGAPAESPETTAVSTTEEAATTAAASEETTAAETEAPSEETTADETEATPAETAPEGETKTAPTDDVPEEETGESATEETTGTQPALTDTILHPTVLKLGNPNADGMELYMVDIPERCKPIEWEIKNKDGDFVPVSEDPLYSFETKEQDSNGITRSYLSIQGAEPQITDIFRCVVTFEDGSQWFSMGLCWGDGK